jgi:hypothetical protein
VSVGAVSAELAGGIGYRGDPTLEFPRSRFSGSLRLGRMSLTRNLAEVVVQPCFHTVCKNNAANKGTA